MRRSLWQKRIPTLLGLFLLGGGLMIASYLVNNGQLFITQASPDYTPENIRVTNLTDTSFTVSYTTSEPATGSLSYHTGNEGNEVALDDRDQPTGTPKAYRTHHITVKNLEPQRSYTYTITSKDKTFLDTGDKPFTVTTLTPLTETPPSQQPIVGKVIVPDTSSTEDVLVFLVSENAQVLSVLPKQDGSFVLPLNSLRTHTLDSYLALDDSSVISMLITNAEQSSNVKLLASQINPVPPITLSQHYDFTTTAQPAETNSFASEAANLESFPSFSANEASPQRVNTIDPEILTPDSNEAFNDQQPSFRGVALPGEDVEILIQSENEIAATIQADANGEWSFRPDSQLEPGQHTITIRTRNAEGIIETLTRSFTVHAAGSQFIEPSVSPTEPTPTPTVATPTPTLEPPTPTPTPIIVEVTITPPPPEEEPGSSFVLISGILAALAVLSGSFLLFTSGGRKSL